MHTTVGIQARRTAGWRLPPGAVLVSRTSRWGNPFTVASILAAGDADTHGEARAVAVRRHEAWLDGEGPDTYRISTRLQVSRARVNDQIGQLAGRVLACPCPVDELPCHRDTLARRAAERGVYAERAQLIALLAAHYPAVLSSDPDDAVRADVVYVDTPAGQLSWHLAAIDVAAYFDSVQRAGLHHTQLWDGHSTEEKFRRIRALTRSLATEPSLSSRRADAVCGRG